MDFAVIFSRKIVEKIFSYLQLKDLLACSEVCVGWYHLANTVSLWRPFVSNFENCWVPDSELGECDAITTNFLDDTRGLNSIFQFEPLSPLNPCKTFIRQRNFLKYNWVHGIYAEHCIQPKDFKLTKFSQVKVEYPSKTAQDCLYYPILGTRGNGEEGLYLIRLDNKPRIVCRLIETMEKKVEFHVACVMRDCVVCMLGDTIQFFDLSCDLSDSEVQTLGTVEEEDSHLTMDVDFIVAWNRQCLYVWCKKTHDLKFSKKYQPKRALCLFGACLSFGLLVTHVKFYGKGFTIEIHNTKNNFERIIQHRFNIFVCLLALKCSKTSIIIKWYVDRPNSDHIYKVIHVFDKRTLSIEFSHKITRLEEFEVIDNVVLIYDQCIDMCYYSPDFESLKKLNISSGECVQLSLSAVAFDNHFVFLFDNILILENYSSKFIEVWDWEKNVKLFNLSAKNRIKYEFSSEDCYSNFDDMDDDYTIAQISRIKQIGNALDCAKKLPLHVSEARLVALDWNGKFQW